MDRMGGGNRVLSDRSQKYDGITPTAASMAYKTARNIDIPPRAPALRQHLLSEHGCLDSYLHIVARRELLPCCHECGADSTTGDTLQECPA